MADSLGIRELRQNLSRHLERVKAGESIAVTDRGTVVARLVPAAPERYADLAERFSATVPTESLEVIAARLKPAPSPAGTTDAFLAESRTDRRG